MANIPPIQAQITVIDYLQGHDRNASEPIFGPQFILQLHCWKNQMEFAHDIQGRGEHAPNMVMQRVQMQTIFMQQLLPKSCPLHYISLDHPKAHELTNHILQPSPEPGLRSPGPG